MTDTATVEAPEQAPPAEQQEPALKEGSKLFQFSSYVHLGEGADVCEHMADGECQDVEHCHAWVRIPNPYQHREIMEKAQAAAARKRRQLRDTETDGYAVLEAELDELRIAGLKEPLIEVLLQKEWGANYLQAMRDLHEQEEWATIEHDQNRMVELQDAGKDDDEEAEERDEILELGKHLEAYSEALEARVKELTDPERLAYEGQEIEQLVESLREQRIEQIATESYLHVYGAWEIVSGTYSTKRNKRGRHTERLYDNPGDLREEPPEIIDTLKATLDRLRVSLQESATGNP